MRDLIEKCVKLLWKSGNEKGKVLWEKKAYNISGHFACVRNILTKFVIMGKRNFEVATHGKCSLHSFLVHGIVRQKKGAENSVWSSIHIN